MSIDIRHPVSSDTLFPERGRKHFIDVCDVSHFHLFRHLIPREGTETIDHSKLKNHRFMFRYLTRREGTETIHLGVARMSSVLVQIPHSPRGDGNISAPIPSSASSSGTRSDTFLSVRGRKLGL